jgi:hypothetical protein
MKKKVLSEILIFEDILPTISKVNNTIIKNSILEKIIKEINFIGDERYKDIEINDNQNITWLIQYICDNMNARHDIKLYPINIFANIHEKNENYIKRNYINFFDYKKCPDYTCMYFVDSDENNLIFEYDEHKKNYLEIPFNTGKIILWDSSLDHYLMPNKNELRVILGCNFKKI